MEPPSTELAQQLTALGLASAADLRRCAGRAKRLSRGLPITDGVWLDALAGGGKLTLFQARAFERELANELVIGRRYVLHRPIHLDPLLSIYEARHPGRREGFLISQIPCAPAEGDAAALRLLKTIKSLSACRDACPGLPLDGLLERENLMLVAPFQRGESIARLLVRRGRFPEAVVRVIAQDLLRQLQATEQFAVHGDLRVANLWLTQRGEVALLNWGLLDAAIPEINIHSQLPLDACDGIAPERLEPGQRSSAASDVYGLGCLLWHLLAGRPPFPVADRLGKLTAQRMRMVPDVRSVAPDVSEPMAQLIRSMTARDVHRRPVSCREVRQLLGPGSGWNRRRLQRFFEQFESAAPQHPADVRKPSRIPALAGAALLTLGLTWLAWNREQWGWQQLSRLSAAVADHRPARELRKSPQQEEPAPEANPAPLAVTASAAGALADPSMGLPELTPPQDAPASAANLLDLPAPTLDGMVILEAGGHYSATTIIAGETLILRGDRARPAVLHVRGQAFQCEARNVRLENIQLIIEASVAGGSDRSPVQFHAETLALTGCRFDWRAGSSDATAMQWESYDESAAGAARLLIYESVFTTAAGLLRMRQPLAAARLEQVLTLGTGTLLALDEGVSAGVRVPVTLNACTFRQCGSLFRLPITSDTAVAPGRLSLQGTASVIDVRQGEPVLALTGRVAGSDWKSRVEVAAAGLVVEVGSQLIAEVDPQSGRAEDLDSSDMPVDGLLMGDFHFSGQDWGQPDAHRLVIDALPVRPTSGTIGVDLDRLSDPR